MNATSTVTVKTDFDHDVENPLDGGGPGYKLHTFDRGKLITCCRNPEQYVKAYRGGKVAPATDALRRKLKAGTAWWISIYEHGERVFSLMGEGPQCRWDTVQLAGILLWTGKPSDLGKDAQERTERARLALRVYTDWANGHCFYFAIEKDGEDLDSCGGYIGATDVIEAAKESLKENGIDPDSDDVEWLGVVTP